MIKALFSSVFLVCLLATGVQAQDAKSIPDLKGSWQATAVQFHFRDKGHIKHDGKGSKLVVTSQEGRVFSGSVEWSHPKATGKENFSGVFDKDGVTFYAAGHTDAFRLGKMEGPDAFTLYIVASGGKSPKAGYVEFKRVQ